MTDHHRRIQSKEAEGHLVVFDTENATDTHYASDVFVTLEDFR